MSALDTLKSLDEQLVNVLRTGDVRLLRRSWVLEQPKGFSMPRRQKLEELEQEGCSPSPLLQPHEAVELVGRASRSTGVLSYGWLSVMSPDPVGIRLAAVQAAFKEHSYLEALFWDVAALYQKPRSLSQDDQFKNALGVMGDLYASAVATTVLQLKEIPERPREMDGSIYVHEPKGDERALREFFDPYGEIELCELRGEGAAIVRFCDRADALKVLQQAHGMVSDLPCTWLALEYYDRAYDNRGWCCFEDAVSSELIVQLMDYPKMRAVMEKLPPKLLTLSSDHAPVPKELLRSQSGSHVIEATKRIAEATFTGKGDEEQV